MHELALPSTLGLKANARAACLKRFAVRTRGNFHVLTGGRKPGFDVIRFCGSKSRVARAELHDTIVDSQSFEQHFRVAHEGFQFLIAVVWPREFEQLDLLKLMLALDA